MQVLMSMVSTDMDSVARQAEGRGFPTIRDVLRQDITKKKLETFNG
jgi:hypothetical protein